MKFFAPIIAFLSFNIAQSAAFATGNLAFQIRIPSTSKPTTRPFKNENYNDFVSQENILAHIQESIIPNVSDDALHRIPIMDKVPEDTASKHYDGLLYDDIDMHFLQSSTDSKESSTTTNSFLPLVISPKHDASLEFLTRFLQTHQDWVQERMLQHGAVLFRGFNIDSAVDVELAAKAAEPSLHNTYRGTSPRNAQPGTEYVFSAAEVPAHFPIAQHLEMSFLPQPPKSLFFSALKAPNTVGGETALADFRQVYRDLPKRLREKLTEKKLRYTRTHHKRGTPSFVTHDVASMQSWSELFGTENKTQIEHMAQEENMPMKWVGRGSNTFVSEFESEPFQLHPVSKEPVWFNHAQVFHWTKFPAELFFAWKRTKEWKFLARSIVLGIKSVIQYGLLRQKMAMHVSFGDGTPISLWEMHQIRKAVHKNMIFNRWKKGDLLMIDNFSTSHGRQPTYDSGRKVVVAWSAPIEKSNEEVIVRSSEELEWQ